MSSHNQGQRLSFAALVSRLSELVLARKTGTIFLLTDARRYARIGLKRGRITHLVHGRYKGADALEHIAQIDSGLYSFSDNVVSDTEELTLPPTDEIIQWLSDVASAGQELEELPPPGAPAPWDVGLLDQAEADDEAPAEPPASTELPDTAALSPGGATPLRLYGPALHEAVTRELALYLGPIAPMITTDYRAALITASTADAVLATVRAIAEEIGSPDQGESFCRRVMERTLGH